MTYARIVNGAVAAYPYTLRQLRLDFPDTSFAHTIPDERLAEYGVLPVQPTPAPDVPLDKNLVETVPLYAGGVCTQQWALIDATAEQIAERQEIAAQLVEFDAAKLDAWIVQFMAMTPAQAQQYVLDNGATLAAVRTNVGRLAYAVRFMLRRILNR